MVMVRRVSPAEKATGLSAALLALVAVACFVAVLLNAPSDSTSSLVSEDSAPEPENDRLMRTYLGSAARGMNLLRSQIPSSASRPGEAKRLANLFESGKRNLVSIDEQVVRDEKEGQRQAAKRRAASKAMHAAHRAAAQSLTQVGRRNGAMDKVVERSEAELKMLRSQIPPAERRAYPKEASEVAGVLSNAFRQLQDIEKANSGKKAVSRKQATVVQSLNAAPRASPRAANDGKKGALDREKAADDEENTRLSKEKDAGDVLDAINSLPVTKRSAPSAHRTGAKQAQTQSLSMTPQGTADNDEAVSGGIDETGRQVWGEVYEPEFAKVGGKGTAEAELSKWGKEAASISSGHDPMAGDDFDPESVKSNWWKTKAYRIKGTYGDKKSDDDWWVHKHVGRGY